MNEIITNDQMQVLQAVAQTAHRSGLYNEVGGLEKILMILLAAHDLGIKPTIALNGGIWNIQGKIEVSARLMTSMIRRAGHSIIVKQCDDKACILKGTRIDSRDELEASFTIEDAQKARLIERDVWKKFTQDMLYNRAMSRLARRLFPDVIGTAYVEGEIADSDLIDVTPKPSTFRTLDCISDEEYNTIIALSSQCDPDYMDKLRSYLKDLELSDFSQIPRREYNKILNGMRKNSEIWTKKQLEVTNV